MTTMSQPATDLPIELPIVLADVEVVATQRLSPSFVRLVLGGAGLAGFGVDGPTWDQRIKLIVPAAGVELATTAELEVGADGWYAAWLALPEERRGTMRTYTVRSVDGTGADTVVTVDVVLHGGDGGPGEAWAARAAIGDRAWLVGPRTGRPFGGIEFAPLPDARLLLVGDETAVPAVAAILEQLPADATGAAYLEVPFAEDVQALTQPDGVQVIWLPRSPEGVGAALIPAVRRHLGLPAAPGADPTVEVDPDLWETPTYSSSGDTLQASRPVSDRGHVDYAWVAGEAGMVTALRRAMTREAGLSRAQVAFMGYWRIGVSMKG